MIEVAYKAELAESDNPEQLLADIKARLNKVRSPFRSAEFFEIEDIIEPARTRETLCQWANLAAEALQPGPSRFGYLVPEVAGPAFVKTTIWDCH